MPKESKPEQPPMYDGQGRLTRREWWSRAALAGLVAIAIVAFAGQNKPTDPNQLTVDEQATRNRMMSRGSSETEAVSYIMQSRLTPQEQFDRDFQRRQEERQAAELQAAACKISGC